MIVQSLIYPSNKDVLSPANTEGKVTGLSTATNIGTSETKGTTVLVTKLYVANYYNGKLFLRSKQKNDPAILLRDISHA